MTALSASISIGNTRERLIINSVPLVALDGSGAARLQLTSAPWKARFAVSDSSLPGGLNAPSHFSTNSSPKF